MTWTAFRVYEVSRERGIWVAELTVSPFFFLARKQGSARRGRRTGLDDAGVINASESCCRVLMMLFCCASGRVRRLGRSKSTCEPPGAGVAWRANWRQVGKRRAVAPARAVKICQRGKSWRVMVCFGLVNCQDRREFRGEFQVTKLVVGVPGGGIGFILR